MPAAIDNSVKTNVIKQWLNGGGRDKIANDNQIGAGTVTGIINEFKMSMFWNTNRLGNYQFHAKNKESIWARLLPLSE